MHLKILGHPIFSSLNFHMPMIVDLSHPLIMLQGENGAGKSTLLHSIFYALRGDQVEGYVYRLEPGGVKPGKAMGVCLKQHQADLSDGCKKRMSHMGKHKKSSSDQTSQGSAPAPAGGSPSGSG